MRTLLITLSMLLSVSAIACTPASAANKNKQKEVKLPFKGSRYENDKNYFRAFESGTSTNQSTAKKMALHNAKVLLASNLEATVKAVTDQYINQMNTTDGIEDASTFQQQSREVIRQVVGEVSIIDEKLFMTKDGRYTYWIAIEMPKEALRRGISAQVKESTKINQAEFQKIFDREMANLE